MEYDLVRVNVCECLPPGTQIAVKGLLKNLDPRLKYLYPVVSPDGYYYHHGVHLSSCEVIHFSAEENKADAKPRKCDINEFRSRGEDRGALYKVVYKNKERVLPLNQTVAKAEEVINQPDKWPKYHILDNNCESFACWLKTGQKKSVQASNAISYAIPTVACVGLMVVLVAILYIQYSR
ncbi:Hypothetical predicted protein [Paramuricea clavata]|uniref:Uncharacterized protein n=1 Tax=Paramuricea clavata TaxID=317549 RepID=A0A7D9IAC2_PARCT|nr:Hypothetical predicted protein [Paramuricea clavata]